MELAWQIMWNSKCSRIYDVVGLNDSWIMQTSYHLLIYLQIIFIYGITVKTSLSSTVNKGGLLNSRSKHLSYQTKYVYIITSLSIHPLGWSDYVDCCIVNEKLSPLSPNVLFVFFIHITCQTSICEWAIDFFPIFTRCKWHLHICRCGQHSHSPMWYQSNFPEGKSVSDSLVQRRGGKTHIQVKTVKSIQNKLIFTYFSVLRLAGWVICRLHAPGQVLHISDRVPSFKQRIGWHHCW